MYFVFKNFTKIQSTKQYLNDNKPYDGSGQDTLAKRFVISVRFSWLNKKNKILNI